MSLAEAGAAKTGALDTTALREAAADLINLANRIDAQPEPTQGRPRVGDWLVEHHISHVGEVLVGLAVAETLAVLALLPPGPGDDYRLRAVQDFCRPASMADNPFAQAAHTETMRQRALAILSLVRGKP